jgi:hypothetical protein
MSAIRLAGLTATTVQNPLTSLADDVAHTRRVLALQDGPTILAGHYDDGGMAVKAVLVCHLPAGSHDVARA